MTSNVGAMMVRPNSAVLLNTRARLRKREQKSRSTRYRSFPPASRCRKPDVNEADTARSVRPTARTARAADVTRLTGLEIFTLVRDGRIALPPLIAHMGIECTRVESGEVEATLSGHSELVNMSGTLHGGAVATLLDSTMGAAAHTVQIAGTGIATVDLTITYLRPLREADMPVRAVGKVINQTRNLTYATGDVRDRKGRLVAHAVGNFIAVAVHDVIP